MMVLDACTGGRRYQLIGPRRSYENNKLQCITGGSALTKTIADYELCQSVQ